MEALAEDLLMSGAYDDALTVTRSLRTRAYGERDRPGRLPPRARSARRVAGDARDDLAHRRRGRGELERDGR